MNLLSSNKKQTVAIIAAVTAIISLVSLTVFVSANQDAEKDDQLFSLDFINSPQNLDPDSLDISKSFYFETRGQASYYGRKFHNRRTANGERFDMFSMTAAHKKLPFGSIIRVTNVHSGKSTLIRINDRGPYVGRRIIDLSYAAARELNGLGLPKVKLESMLHTKDEAQAESLKNHVFAFSPKHKLLCLPANYFSIENSTAKFDKAIDYLETKEKQDSSSKYYLLVSAAKRPQPETKKDNYQYFIGKLNTQSERMIPVISNVAMTN